SRASSSVTLPTASWPSVVGSVGTAGALDSASISATSVTGIANRPKTRDSSTTCSLSCETSSPDTRSPLFNTIVADSTHVMHEHNQKEKNMTHPVKRISSSASERDPPRQAQAFNGTIRG